MAYVECAPLGVHWGCIERGETGASLRSRWTVRSLL